MLRLAMETSLSVTLVFISYVTATDWTDLAKFSNISTSHTCKADGLDFSCNNTCQVTDSTNSSYIKPLLNATLMECRNGTFSGAPDVAIQENGNIIFGDENCTHRTTTFHGTSWTISFWAKYNGTQSRTLIEVQSNSTTLLSINTSYYRVGATSDLMNLQRDVWTFIVLRMTTQKAIYLDINSMNKFVRRESNIQENIQILFGPQTNISAYVVQIVDARIYSHCLTDREVMKLSNGTLAPKLDLQDNCLCPRDSPTVLPGSLNYGIFCRDHNNISVYRLNNYTTHLAEYAVDSDENTYWNSGNTTSANITLDLKNVFQLSSIEINFLLDTKPSELALTLSYKGQVSKRNICGCTSSPPCNLLGNFTYNIMNGTDLTNRTSYITLLADKVNIQLNGSCNNKTFYAISEIKITGSCHCSGNSTSCMFNGTDWRYSCACTTASKTNGSHCETCSDGFWRNSTFDLNCQNLCSCNLNGSFNSSCNEVDGQCYCKSNVMGLQCDQCKHNSYNFSSNGCTGCKCNPDGITECNSTGHCVCKPNVETKSGTCESCMPNYYGIRNISGCTECRCNENGRINPECNKTSGQCACKSNVTGRTCDKCKDEYWGLNETNPYGCVACKCNIVVGSINNTCDTISGQCPCHDNSLAASPHCDPELTGTNMTPTYGPRAGGTYVTLSGQQLGNQEVNVTVLLRDVPANIITRNSTTIVFKTVKSNIGTADVNITWFKWKNQNYTFPDPLKFDYRENAVLQNPTSNLQAFSSGWCNIELTGTSLNSVYRPEIILYGIDGASNITGTCNHTIEGTSILCKPPNVSTLVTNGTYSYGIVLDGITDFLNMKTSMIEIQPDPTFNPKEEIVYRNVFDKVITIKGEGFRRACRYSDFRAHLSKRGDCEIKDITDTEITCDPRETFPGTGEKEALKIYIGDLEKDVGMVEFRTFWKLQEFIYICIGVGGFVLIVIITIIVCCICRRRYRSENMPEDKHEDILMRNPNQNRKGNSYVGVANPGFRMVEKDLDKSFSELFKERLPQHVAELVSTSIIDKSHIELGDICTGKGTYIRVINGKYASYSSTPYAGDGNTIKTLVQNYPAEGEIPNWLNLGLQECTRLRDVVHDNVLRLRGIAIDERKIYVVYPPMERTLKDYIQKTYGSQEIIMEDVVGFCFDVGEGMQELHRQRIIHKDLAARNCMVDCEKVVKVADASFASDLYPEEYIKQQNRDLPVRWMAVESLQQIGFYDKATDMWSYGVLLWEIFTGCRYLPYHDLPNNEIHVNVAMQGYRLGKPENIPQAYLDIFEQCMNTDSKLRPTFEAVLSCMKATLDNPGQVIYQNQEENYVNQSVVDHSHYMNKSAIDQSDQSDLPAPPPRKRTR